MIETTTVAPPRAPRAAPQSPVLTPPPASVSAARSLRWRTMVTVGARMMFHDKLKFIGTLFGVIFAVVLANQQVGVFLGLLSKNTMFIDNAGADMWIAPPHTNTLQGGKPLSMSAVYAARTTPGVSWAEPLLFGSGAISLPSGASEPLTLIGTKGPQWRGGPWNIVLGTADALAKPDAMIFEDSERDKLGGLNLGSIRELNGHRVVASGFTWGLLPFAPSFAFADYDFARSLTGTASDETNYVLVGLAPGADAKRVLRDLQGRISNADLMTASEFHARVERYLLVSTGIGTTTGTSTAFGLIVGLVIVGLSMFSAVIDNIREFGTLKAIGSRNTDLALMLFVQSAIYGVLGSIIGLFMITMMGEGMRSPQLALVLPWQAFAGTPVLMVLLCGFASLLALSRVRKLEPGMVFR